MIAIVINFDFEVPKDCDFCFFASEINFQNFLMLIYWKRILLFAERDAGKATLIR